MRVSKHAGGNYLPSDCSRNFGFRFNYPVWNAKWSSDLDLAWLARYDITRKAGAVEKYAGTLSPCDYTSCADSPKLRATWSNTMAWDKLSLTGTVYYTSGYNLAEVDYGGDPADCKGSAVAGAGSPTYFNTTIPVLCSAHPVWNVDLNAKYRINERLQVYLDALNVFNIAAPFEPSAAYSNAYYYPQYNVAYATENAIGRFVRVGVRADF